MGVRCVTFTQREALEGAYTAMKRYEPVGASQQEKNEVKGSEDGELSVSPPPRRRVPPAGGYTPTAAGAAFLKP